MKGEKEKGRGERKREREGKRKRWGEKKRERTEKELWKRDRQIHIQRQTKIPAADSAISRGCSLEGRREGEGAGYAAEAHGGKSESITEKV